ncbi:MAG: hypothetical protein KAX84_18130 [Burkholderiales bacterium]|nr:hypothetical protein [Burkholderiales bacterium]
MNFALAPDAAGLDSAKGMNETAILQRIRLDLGLEPTVRLFRNNVGVLRDAQGRPVRFGLHPGSGDLIGWRSVRITPDMVGRLLAVLASVEVKTATGKPRSDQVHWAKQVLDAGGFAGIARNTAQARHILGLPL